jgi:hypothetical protein
VSRRRSRVVVRAPRCGLVGLLGCLAVALPSVAEPALDVSSRPQLFLDDVAIRRLENLERFVCMPEKHPANPLIVRDRPWEKRVIEIYGTVLFDGIQDRYRCWYLANEYKDGIPDNPEHPKTAEYFTCYAESADGIRWDKPNVGEGVFGAHPVHNVVLSGTHGFCVLPEPDDPDPARRYKGAGGALFGTSPDGLHWTTTDWRPSVGKNDTSTCVVRWRGEYLAYVRYQIQDPAWPGVMRGVGLSTSPDFQTWSPKELVFKTDTEDGYPWTQPYGISVAPYGDVLVGILWLLHLDPEPGNNSTGTMDTQLVVSRDGRTWSRVAGRAPFLTPTAGAWDAGRVFPGTTLFVKDGRIHVYYTGVSTRHGEGWGEMGIGLATLPEDRIVGLRPVAGDAGVLETPLLQYSGSELLLNADLGKGSIQVALVDAAGNELPGFGSDVSALARHDSLRFSVNWEGKNLGSAGQGPHALRILLRDANLYAFQITGEPNR